MSHFYNPPTMPVARKAHRCTYCAGPIPIGEKHKKQVGVFDGSWFENRYHFECWDALADDGCFEFTPGEGEMPERIKAMTQTEDQP